MKETHFYSTKKWHSILSPALLCPLDWFPSESPSLKTYKQKTSSESFLLSSM